MVQMGSREDILLNPVDAYVSAFVRDVNRPRMLTTERVMAPSEALAPGGNAAAYRSPG